MLIEPKIWTPRTHQTLASDYLFDNQRCNLWAHPGLGKTSICYRMFDLLQLCGSNFFPVLVVAPLAVARDVWPAEQTKWSDFAGLKCVPILGTPQQRIAALMIKADIYTTNYENIEWLVNYFGDRWPFQIIIADESTKLRGFRTRGGGTKRPQALSQIADKVKRWVNLTGTPAPHGLESLWGQQWFVDRGHRLGDSYSAFLKRWFIVEAHTNKVHPKANARDEINSRLADCSMSLRAEDWLPIDKPNYFQKMIDLPDEARGVYKLMERKLFTEIAEKQIIAANAMVKSLKLVQIASGSVYDEMKVAHFVHDAKIQALRSLYDELQENLLVIYHFNFDITAIQKEFPDAVVYQGKKQEDLWNEGKIGMMLIHPKSGGHGLNLQYGGRAVAYYTNTWDLELRQQVLERIGPTRQFQAGFKRAVLMYDLTMRNTVDENILDVLFGRATEQDALMAAHARAMS